VKRTLAVIISMLFLNSAATNMVRAANEIGTAAFISVPAIAEVSTCNS